MRIPGDTHCECTDTGCPMHSGESYCNCLASVTLYRIDMDDYTGIAMCDDCANDALLSGLYTEELDELLETEEEYV